ncbi:TetR/AcrR family transcriptional regulator C-terminal domain-containing protein [Streptomyces sp. NPDC003710]
MIESRTAPSPAVLDHMNSLIGTFRAGGLSADLTHHAVHALGSRMWGFTQEVFPTAPPPADPELREIVFRDLAMRYPHIVEIATAGAHDPGSVVGLDLLLDGVDRLHQRSWSSAQARDRDG